MIFILCLLLGNQPIPTTDISIDTTMIAIVTAVVFTVLIIAILLCVLCIVCFKNGWYTHKLKGTFELILTEYLLL